MVTPNKVTGFDGGCVSNKIELTLEQVEVFKNKNCQNDDCKGEFFEEMAVIFLLIPVSAVVSGSIAIVGNTMYWLEEKAKCI